MIVSNQQFLPKGDFFFFFLHGTFGDTFAVIIVGVLGCYWHLVHRGQGCYQTSYTEQPPKQNYPHVNSAEVEKPCLT